VKKSASKHGTGLSLLSTALGGGSGGLGDESPAVVDSGRGGGGGGHRLVSVESLDEQYRQDSVTPKGGSSGREEFKMPQSDPVKDLKYLPGYLLGGEEVTGFSTLLGHALSLLYVARHGLKEAELWSILAQFSNTSETGSRVGGGAGPSPSSPTPLVLTSEMKALVGVCHHYREDFSLVWKAADLLHAGRLSKAKLLVGMQRVNSEFSASDLDNLLLILDCQPLPVSVSPFLLLTVFQNPASTSSLKNYKTVSYPILLERLMRAHRLIKLKKKTLHSSTAAPLSCSSDGSLPLSH
jgi:hypothetical protein